MAQGDSHSGSSILVEECFQEEADRFVEEVRKLDSLKKLASFADRWKKDPRPWAREQLLAYLDEPLNRPGHHPIVKRIFKHAEQTGDHELMGAFLVAFDRSVRRRRRTRLVFQQDADQWVEEEFLVTPRNSIPAKMTRSARSLYTGKKIEVPVKIGPESRLFSAHTRNYLRRRAWRYFRHLGFRDAAGYVDAISLALRRYRDEDFAAGENILDNWGLLHVCYQHDDTLRFTSSRALVKGGKSISELRPAPYFLESWKTQGAGRVLLALVRQARSRLVRAWAMDLLRQEHAEALSQLSPEDLADMFEREYPDVQEFGAELLQSASGLDKAPLSMWLSLIKTRNPTALAIVCDLMKERVSAERLSLGHVLELALAKPAPVAEMGLGFLKRLSLEAPADRARLTTLAQAQCSALGREIAAFALAFFQSDETYDREVVSGFLDSMLPEMRNKAWDWMQQTNAARRDPILWQRLLETPFPELRQRVIAAVETLRGGAPAALEDLVPVWIASLLDVHRGGRQKLSAIRQITKAIAKKPERADALLPLIRVAVRSIRGPEQRAGLAAVVTLVEKNPDLIGKVKAILPELVVDPEGASP